MENPYGMTNGATRFDLEADQCPNSAEEMAKMNEKIAMFEEEALLSPPTNMNNGYINKKMSQTFSVKDFDDCQMSNVGQDHNRNSFDNELDGVCQSQETLKKTMNRRKRVVRKGGFTNVTYKNISKKKRRYISDLYTTLLDAPWRYLIIMFAASFYVSWILFAVIYYVIMHIHGDFDPEVVSSEGWVPCVLEVDSFAASFLFSLETQHTIGYGTRQTTTECPEAMIFMSLQSVLGCLIQAFMVGLVFSKLSKPSSRSKTVVFSQQAVINLRNKRLCLVFRIGDLRDDNFILGTQISAKLLRRRITQEGEIFQEMERLKVDPDSSNEPCIFFVWPLEIVHEINEESPLYDMSASDIAKEKFEIVVIMEGTIETSSMNFQARTSYLPQELLWGHRFEPMTLYRKDHNKFQVNFSAFHSTYEVETPICSARELDNFQNRENAKLQLQRGKMSMPHLTRGVHPSTIYEQPDNQNQYYPTETESYNLPANFIRNRSASLSRQSQPQSAPRQQRQSMANGNLLQTPSNVSNNIPHHHHEHHLALTANPPPLAITSDSPPHLTITAETGSIIAANRPRVATDSVSLASYNRAESESSTDRSSNQAKEKQKSEP